MGRHRLYDTDAILDFIKAFKTAHDGNSPTYRAIKDHFNMTSVSIVTHHLRILEKEGSIQRKDRMIFVPGGEWRMKDEL